MEKITQKKMARYTTLANRIEKLRGEFAELKNEIISDLDAGAKPEPGARTAKITQVERRSVAWKDVVLRELGEGYAKRVLAGTKPTFFFKLTVK